MQEAQFTETTLDQNSILQQNQEYKEDVKKELTKYVESLNQACPDYGILILVHDHTIKNTSVFSSESPQEMVDHQPNDWQGQKQIVLKQLWNFKEINATIMGEIEDKQDEQQSATPKFEESATKTPSDIEKNKESQKVGRDNSIEKVVQPHKMNTCQNEAQNTEKRNENDKEDQKLNNIEPLNEGNSPDRQEIPENTLQSLHEIGLD